MKKLLISVSCIVMTGACLAQAPVVDITASDLEDRLAILERIVDSRTESQQRMQNQVNDLQSDIDEMRGSIELHNHQLEKLLERQRELFLELDKRFESMKQDSSNLATNIANIDQNTTSTASGNNEQSAYQAAVNLILKDKDYESAVPAFQAFLAKYPNSDLTANAHYWLGQLLYNQQNYNDAKKQFEQVVNKFESSPKRADSLLKLGLIEKSVGNTNAANDLFNQVVKTYPNSTPARLAAQQLAK